MNRDTTPLAVDRTTTVATLAAVLASVCFGTVPYFAKLMTDAGMAPHAVAFYRYLLVAIVLLPFLRVRPEMRPTLLWGLLCGAAMGVGWTGYVVAIKSVPVSTVGVLYMTYPMFTLVIAWLWFRQEFGLRSIAACVIVLTAAALATTPAADGSFEISTILIALAAPITFGLAINILVSKLSSLPPLSALASVALGAFVGLLPLVLSQGPEQLLPASPADWWLILGIALITALIPQLLYVVSAPRIGAAKSAMAGGVELPTMFLIAWLAFGESIGSLQLVAGVMILVALAMTPARRPETG